MDKRNLGLLALFLMVLVAAALHFYRPTNAPRYDIVINEKGEPVSTDPNIIQEDLIDEKHHEIDSSVLELKDYTIYFTESRMDKTIRKNLESRMGHKENGIAPAFDEDYLSRETPLMISSLRKLFMKFPKEGFQKERWHLMNLVFETAQETKKLNETYSKARDFFKWIIVSKVEPGFKGDDFSDSNQYMALMLYLNYEYDLKERRRVTDIVLDEVNAPDDRKKIEDLLKIKNS